MDIRSELRKAYLDDFNTTDVTKLLKRGIPEYGGAIKNALHGTTKPSLAMVDKFFKYTNRYPVWTHESGSKLYCDVFEMFETVAVNQPRKEGYKYIAYLNAKLLMGSYEKVTDYYKQLGWSLTYEKR